MKLMVNSLLRNWPCRERQAADTD